jgi:hypothetical protein
LRADDDAFEFDLHIRPVKQAMSVDKAAPKPPSQFEAPRPLAWDVVQEERPSELDGAIASVMQAVRDVGDEGISKPELLVRLLLVK